MRDVKNPLTVDMYTEHSSNVSVAKFSPSGYYIASGDENGNVRVWATNNKDKTLKLEVRPVSKTIRDIGWTLDSQRVVAVGEGKGLFGAVFLADSGSPVGEISGHSANILSCDVRQHRPMRIVTGGEDNQANFFQGPPFKFDHSFKDHKNYINCTRFSPDGAFFVTVSSDKTINLFDGKDGKHIGAFDNEGAHTASIYSCSWSPDSKFIVTASADKTVKQWDVATKKVVKTFTFGSTAVELMQVSVVWVNADTIISLSLAGDLYYLDLENPAQPKKVVNGHNKKIYSIVADEKNNRFYTSGSDGALIRWDAGVGSSGKPTGKGHTASISIVGLAGKHVVAIAVDQTVRFIDSETFAYTGESVKLDSFPNDIAVSTVDPDYFAVSTAKGVAFFKNCELKHFEEVKGFEPSCIAFSPNDSEIIIGATDKKARVFTVADFKLTQVAVIDKHRGAISKVKYSPDGSMFAIGDSNREIIVYDSASRAEKYTGLVFHTSKISDLAWAKTGAYLASGSVDKSVIVWDLVNSKRATAEIAHLQGVNAITVLNENTVISVGNDFCVRQWEFKF